MKFHTQQFPNGRWGIYKELQLMATVGNIEACKEMLDCLKSSDKKKPKRIDLLDGDAKTISSPSPSRKKSRKKGKRIGA